MLCYTRKLSKVLKMRKRVQLKRLVGGFNMIGFINQFQSIKVKKKDWKKWSKKLMRKSKQAKKRLNKSKQMEYDFGKINNKISNHQFQRPSTVNVASSVTDTGCFNKDFWIKTKISMNSTTVWKKRLYRHQRVLSLCICSKRPPLSTTRMNSQQILPSTKMASSKS